MASRFGGVYNIFFLVSVEAEQRTRFAVYQVCAETSSEWSFCVPQAACWGRADIGRKYRAEAGTPQMTDCILASATLNRPRSKKH
ncbi:hypothetical protein N431DRAFT_432686 [Stipitochalara longipes BDJ]|nr:hypothetical protein N431DRAFT_432686 [Stipitochalara longipes BDJ]